ncbi:MAG: NAD(P)/FAD-dependent oxidoreductase, partial [Chloroflexota bacterium]
LEVPEITAALEDVEVRDDCFVCKLSDGTEIHAGSVILAIGRERRKIGLEHEEEWIGKGVSFCSTCDAPMYKNKTVAVVGGGNAAVEGAILNARHAKQVYLIYRGDNFWRPEPVLVRQLDQYDNLHVLYNTNVTELIGDDTKGLEAIRIDNPYEGKDVLDLDGLFVEIGADPRVEIPRKLGIELDAETDEIHVNKLMETNLPGFYAAGDITDGSGELKQTVTAAAQGAIAALSAYKHVSNKGVRCWHHEAVVDMEKDLEAAATGSEPKR